MEDLEPAFEPAKIIEYPRDYQSKKEIRMADAMETLPAVKVGQYDMLAFKLRSRLDELRNEIDDSVNEIIRTAEAEAELLKEMSRRATRNLHNVTERITKEFGD